MLLFEVVVIKAVLGNGTEVATDLSRCTGTMQLTGLLQRHVCGLGERSSLAEHARRCGYRCCIASISFSTHQYQQKQTWLLTTCLRTPQQCSSPWMWTSSCRKSTCFQWCRWSLVVAAAEACCGWGEQIPAATPPAERHQRQRTCARACSGIWQHPVWASLRPSAQE